MQVHALLRQSASVGHGEDHHQDDDGRGAQQGHQGHLQLGPARHVEDADRHRGGLEHKRAGDGGRGALPLDGVDANHEVVQGVQHLVGPQGHGHPRVGVVALPLGLQAPVELDVLARKGVRGGQNHALRAKPVLAVPEVVVGASSLLGVRAAPLRLRRREGDPHDLAHALVLKIGELGGEAGYLREARDRKSHIAGPQANPEAVGGDGGVHAQPHCQQKIHEGACDRQQVKAIEPIGWVTDPAFAVYRGRETEEERTDQLVHVHLGNGKFY
mmetsp:Transcript_77888/g.228355  ORF Transcript_77888/g.228355 Transcript_77888/m.228355 type:complete len:271 (+) Transcript_77888:68-880(+)